MLLRRPAGTWRLLQGLAAARPASPGLRCASGAAQDAAHTQQSQDDDGQALLAYWRGLLDDRQRPRGTAGAGAVICHS